MAVASSPLQELIDTAGAAKAYRMTAEFDLPSGGRLVLHVSGTQSPSGGWLGSWIQEVKGGNTNWVPCPSSSRLDSLMQDVARMYPRAVLRPESVAISLQKGTTTGAKVQPVAVQAWYEVYGQPIPTLEELARGRKEAKAAKKAAADDTVALLKSGPPGVGAFNERPVADRVAADLRKADLAGADLSGLLLVQGTRLAGARLAGAKLTDAVLCGCRAGDTDFAQANLSGAHLRSSNFPRASFAKADLTGADLAYCDLRGADFTGATLDGCIIDGATFDEETRWPKKFPLPASLLWKGAGPDPRVVPTKREKALPSPTDFAGFLDRLEKATDASKLDKALRMLKADRFRLFAKVTPEHVVGVVKSQSDASLVYSCRLSSDGTYACCTQNLNVCGGLRGSPCKHLLVLVVGLTKAGELDPATAHAWTQASRGQKAALDKDAMTETLLEYKGAEAGEVDWRPTETIPEDFYAM